MFISFTAMVNAQTELTIEGQTYSNSDTTWLGVNIPRSSPAKLTFRNNSITSSNTLGYMLLAGDEGSTANNNNLDNAVITGNRFNWTGTNMTVITHGLFTGHQRNIVIKYNYLNNVPMGVIRKSSNNMSDTGGAIAYNIIKGGTVGINIKGLSNVKIYNNTLYTDRTTSETWRPLIYIYKNTDRGNNSAASGTNIYNNIFYTKYQTFAITISQTECLTDFKCDYNIYWCENGAPRFNIADSVKTFAEWQALGYDTHSVVINPDFKDFINFVPKARLNYGMTLESTWKHGLSTDAVWGTSDPETSSQNGKWQVGARIYKESVNIKPVKKNSRNNISIYPNPARKFINVSNTEIYHEPHTIRIFDIAGTLCLEKLLKHDKSNKVAIDLKPGLYIIQVRTDSSVVLVQKLNIV